MSKNERNTRNENFFRSDTVVAQTHVRSLRKSLVLLRLVDAPQVHPTWDPGGASWRECRASSKKSTQVICPRRYGNGSRRHGSHGKKADHGYVGVEQCERRQSSSLLRIGSSRVVTKVPFLSRKQACRWRGSVQPRQKHTGHVPKDAHIVSNACTAFASATAPSSPMAFS